MTQIPYRAASRILDSVAFLNDHHGLALNTMVTLNFEQLGSPRKPEAKDALTAMNQFLARKIGAFARQRGGCGMHFYVYAHERCNAHGWHVHQLMVTPTAVYRNIRGWLQDWARRNYRGTQPNAINVRLAGGCNLDQKANIQARMLRYILKTVAPCYGTDRDGNPAHLYDLLELRRTEKSKHLDIARMAGSSQNLSLRAQLSAEYRAPLEWEDLLSVKGLTNHSWRQSSRTLTAQLRNINI